MEVPKQMQDVVDAINTLDSVSAELEVKSWRLNIIYPGTAEELADDEDNGEEVMEMIQPILNQFGQGDYEVEELGRSADDYAFGDGHLFIPLIIEN